MGTHPKVTLFLWKVTWGCLPILTFFIGTLVSNSELCHGEEESTARHLEMPDYSASLEISSFS